MASKSQCSWCLLAAALLLMFFARPAHAENSCPWLNEATASGFLGGAATGAYSPATESQPAICTFMRVENGVTRELQLTVEIVSASPHMRVVALASSCVDPAPMTAIGNEATRCMAHIKGAARAERVLSRVRDQVFTITLSTSQRDDGELTGDVMRTRIATVAEQISGNLF
ncbi:MAG TPA: hypothetical protein VF392_11235 [Terracidiphilus sp.]